MDWGLCLEKQNRLRTVFGDIKPLFILNISTYNSLHFSSLPFSYPSFFLFVLLFLLFTVDLHISISTLALTLVCSSLLFFLVVHYSDFSFNFILSFHSSFCPFALNISNLFVILINSFFIYFLHNQHRLVCTEKEMTFIVVAIWKCSWNTAQHRVGLLR